MNYIFILSIKKNARKERNGMQNSYSTKKEGNKKLIYH